MQQGIPVVDDRVLCACASCSFSPSRYPHGCGCPGVRRRGKTPRSSCCHQLAVLQRQTAAWPRLTWTDRALFAALLTLIPRSRHNALHSFITPGTILRWHRDIVRRRWAAKSKLKRPGRPPTHRHIVRLVLRMAAGNEHWGYRRIAGELAGLGIAVAPSTVWGS